MSKSKKSRKTSTTVPADQPLTVTVSGSWTLRPHALVRSISTIAVLLFLLLGSGRIQVMPFAPAGPSLTPSVTTTAPALAPAVAQAGPPGGQLPAAQPTRGA